MEVQFDKRRNCTWMLSLSSLFDTENVIKRMIFRSIRSFHKSIGKKCVLRMSRFYFQLIKLNEMMMKKIIRAGKRNNKCEKYLNKFFSFHPQLLYIAKAFKTNFLFRGKCFRKTHEN